MTDRRREVIANMVDVCASIIATAEQFEQQFLKQVLAEENRSIFVALSLRIAVGKPRIVATLLDVTHWELQDALDPKKHWVEERPFVFCSNGAGCR